MNFYIKTNITNITRSSICDFKNPNFTNFTDNVLIPRFSAIHKIEHYTYFPNIVSQTKRITDL